MSQGKERKSFFRKVFGNKSKEEKSATGVGSEPTSAGSSSKIRPPQPPQSSSISAPKPPFTFTGRDGEECKIFVRDIWQFARQRDRESDERWKAGLAGFCMVGAAKEWYENELDLKTQNNWDLLKVALGERFRTTRDQSETIPTIPADPGACPERKYLSDVLDFSQREKRSYNPTIPTPASVITAEPSMPPSPRSLPSSNPQTRSPSSGASTPHAAPSSPTRFLLLEKPLDFSIRTLGIIRIITWDEQPMYIGQDVFGSGTFQPTANSTQAVRVNFHPTDEPQGLMLRTPLTMHRWLGIAWKFYHESSPQVNGASLVAATAPSSTSGWLSCSMVKREGPIRPFVWTVYPDGSIGARYFDPHGVRRRLTPVIIAGEEDPYANLEMKLVENYDKYAALYKEFHKTMKQSCQPARLVFQPC